MDRSVRTIKGIGEKTEALLAKLNIRTVGDLIHHYPRCYVTYPDPVPVSEITKGNRCSVCACLDGPVHVRALGRKKLVTARIADQTGSVFVRWFNMPYLKNTLRQGTFYVFTGIPVFRDGRVMLEQPECNTTEVYRGKMQTFQPVYPLTSGLSNTTLLKALKEALDAAPASEYLPENVRKYYNLEGEEKALRQVHFPTDGSRLSAARTRIIFDEFFRFFAALSLVSDREEKALNSHLIAMDDRVKEWIASLPFSLTKGQERVVKEIRADFLGTAAMNRLVQGDVGSGKTVVAVIAMYAAVLAGYQAVMMVPTEVLADQHFHTITRFFEGLDVRTGLLTGSMKAGQKREVRDNCRQGRLDILVGTHALLEDTVEFKDLGLVITDEQHRFGVRQREHLMQKGDNPHVLVMSATPIPRSLAMILYRDLDMSIIDEMPADRLPVRNSVISEEKRLAAWAFLKKEVLKGHQAYVICPMISGNDKASMENVTDYSAMLARAMPPEIRVEALTGQMSSLKKAEVMEAFSSGKIQVLVSTTVIEVGIDIKNATVMLIENADRFGLAQLHQLRGRIGRGKDQSYCIFISGSDKEEALKRLSVIGHSNNGFEIAAEDLKLRGPGDFFGTKQSGTMDFSLADIYANADILKDASEAVDHLKKEGYHFGQLDEKGLREALKLARSI